MSARFRGNVTHPGALVQKAAGSAKDVALVLGSNPATLSLNVGHPTLSKDNLS